MLAVCTRSASAVMLGGALALGAACIPLPIRHTKQATPSVEGRLQWNDGSAAVGIAIAVTESEKDKGCTGPGGRGVTDSSGRFHLPPAHVRKRIFWLSLMENPLGSTSYWLCARLDASPEHRGDGNLHVPRTRIAGRLRGDTLTCLGWEWQSALRVTCNAPHQKRILTGGSWTNDGETGTYRVLLPEGEKLAYESRAVVQWITPAPVGASTIAVRAQTELPTGKGVTTEGALLDSRDGEWRLRVKSVTPTTWGNERWHMFELGPPGEFRQVPDA